MSYAVIATGGKQYKVELGQTLEVELVKKSKEVIFPEVLLYASGDQVQIGTPTIHGITVKAEVVNEHKKGEKLRVFKYKAKSRYRKLKGHRQAHSLVKIISIGKESLKVATPVKKVAKPVKTPQAPKKKTVTKPKAPKKTVVK